MTWDKNVRKVTPYVPGEQPPGKVVKLNTNENPYPPSPEVSKALKGLGEEYDICRRYPDPEAKLLVEAIGEYYGVNPERVFVGVGSDDVIAMAFMTFFAGDKPILFPDITYSFYEVWAELFGIPYKTVPLKEDFSIEPSDYFVPNGGIIFPNPNAPTALALETDRIEEIISRNPDSVVIVDEAYIDFGAASVMELTEKYENLLVVQTFSKSRSMAGARIGFAVGSEKLIKYLKDVKFSFNSYTMSHSALRAGAAAVKDKIYFEETIEKIISTRDIAAERLKALGFTFPRSFANFLFATHKSASAELIYEELKKRNIFVRYFKKDRIDNYLRITIGTPEEMEILYAALDEILL